MFENKLNVTKEWRKMKDENNTLESLKIKKDVV